MALSIKQKSDYLSKWRNELEHNIMPFWEKAEDRSLGGVFTCFNNEGSNLLSKDKFTWSQGRFLWNLSEQLILIEQGLCQGDLESYRLQAQKTAEFLKNNAFLPNGNCAFLLTQNGEKKETIKGGGFDSSFYADCFVAIGFAKYAQTNTNKEYFNLSVKLYKNIKSRLSLGVVRSDPYPVPTHFKAYAFEMIMLSVELEIIQAAKKLQDPTLNNLKHSCEFRFSNLLDNWHDQQTLLPFEMKCDQGYEDALLANTKTPGHTLENMWFCLKAAELLGKEDIVLKKIINISKLMWRLGWDTQYGGLLRYINPNGGKPTGRLLGNKFEQLILDTWDSKIWWVHVEALYDLLLLRSKTQDHELDDMYEKTENYVLNTFPNHIYGEWNQICDRKGKPMDKVVALPVKDPFHIMRFLQLTVELCADKN